MFSRHVFITLLMILYAGAGPATAEEIQQKSSSKAKLRDRCLSAIEASEVSVKTSTLKESVIHVQEGQYLFQFQQPDGGVFHCDICDETNRSNNCFTMGLELSHRPAAGENRRLPAELNLKCIYYLQKELSGRAPQVNHDLVERIGAANPHHTDTRWVYQMKVDEKEYRCVIRKSDGNFRVERQDGVDDWRPIAAGTMF